MSQHKFDSTLGALFLGNLCAASLFGITCVQGYIYHKTVNKDSFVYRLLIFSLWCLEFLQLALISHASYYYMVSKFDNISATLSPTWSIFAQIYVALVVTTLIHAIFGRHVWLIYERNHILLGCIGVFSISALVLTFIFASKALKLAAFTDIPGLSHILLPAYVSCIISDLFIAAPLCIALFRRRTGVKNTGSDSVIRVVIMYTINTCVLTTTCMTTSLVTFAIWPDKLIFIGVHYSFSQLYFNSLLATLNNREALAEKLSGTFFFGDGTMQRVDLTSSWRLSSLRFEPVVITVNQEVDVTKMSGNTGKINLVSPSLESCSFQNPHCSPSDCIV